MSEQGEISAVVGIAVEAIRKAAQLVGETGSGINDSQIRELRNAIDDLELKLNSKKRELNASRA